MDIIINFVIIAFVFIALYVTIYYLHRVNDTYNKLIESLSNISRELKFLLESTNNKNILGNCDEIFSKYPNLLETWYKYKKRLNNDGTYALIHSREFFSRDKLINLNTKNRDRIKALPGLLTAWGLLGTFVAILLGLTGIDPNNIATINHLVHGLYAKFASSIVALGCSIFFVFQERGIYSKLNVFCNDFQQTMEEIFPTMSTNEILSSMEANMLLQAETMNKLSNKLAQNSLESIEKMVTMFRNTLTEGTMQQFNSINNVISNLEDTLSDIQDAQDSYLDRMDAMNQNAEIVLEQHEKALSSLDKLTQQVENKVNVFKETIDETRNIITEISKISGNFIQVGENFASITPSINSNNESIKNLTENLENSIKYFNNVTNEISSSKLDEVLAHFKEGIKESLSDIQVGLNEDLNIIKEGYEWHKGQLNKLVDATTSNIDGINSSMNDYSKIATEFLVKYDESISHATSSLNTYVQRLDKALTGNIKQLENNFTDLNKTLKSINENSLSEV